MKDKFTIEEVARIIGARDNEIIEFIRQEWVAPEEPETREFDEEDLARARLICELKDDFGINDEAVPVILSLIDQIHSLRAELRARLGPLMNQD